MGNIASEETMEDWNLDAVKTLLAQYAQCGLGDTSSGRFLASLVADRAPPRGGGITWLRSLLQQGDPTELTARVTELDKLQAENPTLDIASCIRALRSGYHLSDWQSEAVHDACLAVARGRRELTTQELQIFADVEMIRSYRGTTYWSNRAGQHRRLVGILTEAKTRTDILQADIEFVFGTFGPHFKEVTSPTYEIGALVKVPGGERGLVSSDPFVWGGKTVVNVLTGSQIVPIAVSLLRKRIK
jgi:hypothetical protein